MVQCYTMVIWQDPCETKLCEIVESSYDVLSLLQQFDDALSPKYLFLDKVKETREFTLTRENLLNLLERNINKDISPTFTGLGRHISFFSSKSDSESSVINLTTGVSNVKLINTLVVDFPYANFNALSNRTKEFEQLFKQIVGILKPFWGCVYSSLTQLSLRQPFMIDRKPTSVHWINYFENAIVDKIGRGKLLKLSGVEELEHGIYLKLQNELFDAENIDHANYQNEINRQLNLIL